MRRAGGGPIDPGCDSKEFKLLTANWPTEGRPAIVGHRGAAGHAPENTMASFRRGLELSADAVELDVHLTSDRQPVVIHDPRLERTTNGHGWVSEHTLAELNRLDAGRWFGEDFAGEHIPTLDEVAAWARGRTFLVVEMKNDPRRSDGLEKLVVGVLEANRMLDQSMVISFDHYSIRRLRDLEPRISVGVLYACRPLDPAGLATAAGADALLPQWPYVFREDVRAAHAAGRLVSTWATSDPQVIRRVADLGVDGIATDHPDVAVRALEDRPR